MDCFFSEAFLSLFCPALRQGLVGCAAGHQVTEELAIRLGEAAARVESLCWTDAMGSG